MLVMMEQMMKALNEMKNRPSARYDLEQPNLDFGLLPEFPITAVADLLTLNFEIRTIDGVAAQLVIFQKKNSTF